MPVPASQLFTDAHFSRGWQKLIEELLLFDVWQKIQFGSTIKTTLFDYVYKLNDISIIIEPTYSESWKKLSPIGELSQNRLGVHGKIPSNGNWKFAIAFPIVSANMLWCMEKSQVTGIERTIIGELYFWIPYRVHGKIPSNGNWKKTRF